MICDHLSFYCQCHSLAICDHSTEISHLSTPIKCLTIVHILWVYLCKSVHRIRNHLVHSLRINQWIMYYFFSTSIATVRGWDTSCKGYCKGFNDFFWCHGAGRRKYCSNKYAIKCIRYKNPFVPIIILDKIYLRLVFPVERKLTDIVCSSNRTYTRWNK